MIIFYLALITIFAVVFIPPVSKAALSLIIASIYVPCMLLFVVYIKLISLYKGTRDVDSI